MPRVGGSRCRGHLEPGSRLAGASAFGLGPLKKAVGSERESMALGVGMIRRLLPWVEPVPVWTDCPGRARGIGDGQGPWSVGEVGIVPRNVEGGGDSEMCGQAFKNGCGRWRVPEAISEWI